MLCKKPPETTVYQNTLQRGLSYTIFNVQPVWINRFHHRERGLDGRGHF